MTNKYQNRPRLVKKGQQGLTAPAFQGMTIGNIVNNDALLHTADLSKILDSTKMQGLIKAADSQTLARNVANNANFFAKANGALSKSVGGLGSIGGLASSALSVADKFIPQAEDKASKITSGVFNTLSNVAGFIPGFGTAASVALKAAGTLFGAGVKKVKGNAANEVVDTSASYTGAEAYDSKRFGLLGLGSAKRYKNKVAQRQNERNTAYDILQEGKDDLLASTNVQQLSLADNLNKSASDWMYNIRVGELGMKIQEAKRLSRLAKSKSLQTQNAATPEFKTGGNIDKKDSVDNLETTGETIDTTSEGQLIDSGNPPEFKDGGAVNVIPEGALHARKHHLEDVNPELKDVTKKGIPVITAENGQILQHAEIERSEIIFSKSVTDQIEELRKKYNETKDDSIAIEAGQLLAQQIMENTVDNTGELLDK